MISLPIEKEQRLNSIEGKIMKFYYITVGENLLEYYFKDNQIFHTVCRII